MLESALIPGESVDRKYHIETLLGHGSFSQVYRASYHGHDVALKVLKTPGLGQSLTDVLADFKNEFSILKEIHHPHIAGILEFGFDPKLEKFYFTSELIEGSDFVEHCKQLKSDDVTEPFVQALRALNYLHGHRILHLDIKAANLLVTAQPPHEVKLIDFGLATVNPGDGRVGTPSYMAPEIIKHERPDARSDIYSLGVLFYLCLTGKNPFRAKGVQATLEKQLEHIPVPPSELNPAVPKFWDPIILQMLEKNPADRYQNVESILREISAHSKVSIPLETRETLLSYLPDEGRFIGRTREVMRFRTIFRELFENRAEDQTELLICGSAGLGKTRFLKEIAYHCELHEVPVRRPLDRSTQGLTQFFDEIQNELAADERPLAIFLDDIDNLDNANETRGLILALLARLQSFEDRKNPVLLVASCKNSDDLTPELQDFLSPEAAHHLVLKPFTPAEMASYVLSLTGVEHPPDDFIKDLSRRSEGNPALTTEILRSLIESGALFDKNGRWQASVFEDLGVDFSEVRISSNLEELLLERVHRASPASQELLKDFATANGPLTISQLQTLEPKTDLANPIDELRRLGLIERDPEHGTYQILNKSLSQVLYQSLSKQDKGKRHEKLAACLEAQTPQQAYHQLRSPDLSAAIQTALEWGAQYLQKAQTTEATAVYQTILGRLSKKSEAHRIEFQLKLAEAYLVGLDLKSAEAECLEIQKNLEKQHGAKVTQEKIDALTRLGALDLKLGKAEQAKELFDRALGLLTQAGKPFYKQLLLENFKARILLQSGRYNEAEEIFQESLQQWHDKLSEADKKRVTNNDLGLSLLSQGKFEQALEVFENDLHYAKELDDKLLIARSHYNLAEASLSLNNYQRAIVHYKQAASIAQELRNSEILLRAYNGLGNSYRLSGDIEQSNRYYERGLSLCERAGDIPGQVALLVNLGAIEAQHGNHKSARQRLRLAITLLQHKRHKSAFEWQSLCRALLELGEIAHQTNEIDKAIHLLEESLAIADQEDLSLKFWVLASLSEVHFEQDNLIEAMDRCSELEGLATSAEEKQLAKELKMKIIKAPEPPAKETEGTEESPNPYAAILKINQFINAESDLDFVLKTVLHHALNFCEAEIGLVLLTDASGELNVETALNAKDKEALAEFSRSIAKQAFESGNVVMTADAINDVRFSSEASIAGLELRSVLCLPIKSKQQIIGALYLENRYQRDAFGQLDLDVLKAFADQVGIAIENARLLKQAQESQVELNEQLVEMSGKLEYFQNLAPVADRKDGIIGRSKPMRELFSLIDKISDTDLAVYVHGESGTGKELIARALHQQSQRKQRPFVAVNCGAIPENLMESELFGYKAGAFTGATRDKKGLVEEAQGGTLFLDEVGELAPTLQVKLLRLLQAGEFRRVGDSKTLSADIRIVSASNQDLEVMMNDGTFREDLYYRVCQMRLDLAPLRERPEDIPLLVEHFLKNSRSGKKSKIAPLLMKHMIEYSWPGNIRELENLLEVATALAEKGLITESSIPTNHGLNRFIRGGVPQKSSATSGSIAIDEKNTYDPKLSWYDYEKFIIAQALRTNEHHVKKTAQMLGLAPTTLYKKVKEWQLGDTDNPLFECPFSYSAGQKLKDYVPKIFQAALRAHDDKAYTAIERLGVSPGYFYKVMKK